MTFLRKIQKGFTLVELIVAVAVIALLAFVVIVSQSTARQKARDARRVADIVQVRLALEQYFKANRRYPNPDPQGYCGLATALAPYLSVFPKDPLDASASCNGTSPYYYEYFAAGTLQPGEAIVRIPANVFELPKGMSVVFATDEDGAIRPQAPGANWIGGAKAGALACPGGTPCAALDCGTAPEDTPATAVYCIRL